MEAEKGKPRRPAKNAVHARDVKLAKSSNYNQKPLLLNCSKGGNCACCTSTQHCAVCRREGVRMPFCGACKAERYCSDKCFSLDWSDHSQLCGAEGLQPRCGFTLQDYLTGVAEAYAAETEPATKSAASSCTACRLAPTLPQPVQCRECKAGPFCCRDCFSNYWPIHQRNCMQPVPDDRPSTSCVQSQRDCFALVLPGHCENCARLTSTPNTPVCASSILGDSLDTSEVTAAIAACQRTVPHSRPEVIPAMGDSLDSAALMGVLFRAEAEFKAKSGAASSSMAESDMAPMQIPPSGECSTNVLSTSDQWLLEAAKFVESERTKTSPTVNEMAPTVHAEFEFSPPITDHHANPCTSTPAKKKSRRTV